MQDKNKFISICIPSYNSSKTIKETINSILNQSFTNYEIIINNIFIKIKYLIIKLLYNLFKI